MKILHLITSSSWGGLEIYSSEMVARQHKLGLQVLAMVTPNSKVEKYLQENGVPTFAGPTRVKSKIAGSWALRKILKSVDVQVLHCHTRMDLWFAALSSRPEKYKLIYNLYMNAPIKKDFVHRWLFNQVFALCTSSEKIFQDARTNFAIDPNKIRLIRYGRDVDAYVLRDEERQQLRSENQVTPGQVVFTSMARLDEGKGIFELLLAMKLLTDQELSQIQLWVIGEPTILRQTKEETTYEPQSLKVLNFLKAMTSSDRYGKHIKHFGFQKNFIPYLAATDVFCIASYNETYSLSVIDAELMGRPVLGTNAGGTIEQIGNAECGVLVEPRSAESIAAAIRIFLSDAEARIKMGQAAYQWSRANHSWTKTLHETNSIYSEQI